ncbi:pilus assembly protein [Archangium primigenium]|nr:pilus assembly protein [Archangium primigenium]
MVEFALVAPILVSILFFSIYLTDIIRAKYKLQEASRYVAWEMSSYTLSDFGSANHDQAFQTALDSAKQEATSRFDDLDSVDVGSKFGTLLSASAPEVKVTNQAVAGIDLSAVTSGGGSAGQPLNYLLDHFKFNTKGQVEVELTSRLSANNLMPRGYLQKEQGGFYTVDNWGGRDLRNMSIKNRYTLIANGWHLPDGGDAVMSDKRAGDHKGGGTRHGIALQVDRMKFLGAGNFLADTKLDRVTKVFDFAFPAFFGTFVTAHNYKPSPSGSRGCNKDQHTASVGLNNLQEIPGLDDTDIDKNQRCFDTAPFRDTQTYSRSLYKNIFEARGEHFMGCKKAMADMPNSRGTGEGTGRDKNEQKITCE